jgi:hypothetical protein
MLRNSRVCATDDMPTDSSDLIPISHFLLKCSFAPTFLFLCFDDCPSELLRARTWHPNLAIRLDAHKPGYQAAFAPTLLEYGRCGGT